MKVHATLRAALLLLCCGLSCGNYLLVSSPVDKAVHYAPLLSAEEQSRGEKMTVRPLTSQGDLEHPLGLAVDNVRKVMYVADRGARAVVAFHLYREKDGARKGLLAAEDRQVVVSNLDVHWVAVDSVGTLFCSDGEGNGIWSVPASALAAREQGQEAPAPAELYSAAAAAPLRKPQGIAADGLSVFWANGEHAEADGALVEGLESPARAMRGKATMRLSTDTEPAYGVCLSGSHIYYTVRSGRVYETERPGFSQLPGGAGSFSAAEVASLGTPTVVADRLQRPRGCVYDGDGSVFVADTAAGGVYSFAGGAAKVAPHRLHLAAEVPGAYGLALISPLTGGAGTPRRGVTALLGLVVAAAGLRAGAGR